MNISPARAAVFDVLMQIETEQAFSSVLLPLYEERLSLPDRGLCHELTLGVLRRQIFLDKIVDHFAIGKKVDSAVRVALRLGLYQLLFLDKIPAHAAINESVNLVQRAKKSSAKGFVNAILRRATREPISFTYGDDIERISVETSHPRWLIEKWIGEFGEEETGNIAKANNEIPNAAFRFTNRNLSRELSGIRKSELMEDCFLAETMAPNLIDLATNGEIYFQDEASQMVAGAIELSKGSKFLDVCAAPGGKSTLIAERGKSNARLMVAGDLHWPRLEFLRENCRRQRVQFVKIVQYDAEEALPFADASFDSVLVDAPCSGTGTIRHNPEIRYFLKPDDFVELQLKQRAILQNASKVVKQGGSIVYSTCSMEREENEEICREFLSKNVDFSPVKPNVSDRFITSDGFARTYPHRDRMDGFFLAGFGRS